MNSEKLATSKNVVREMARIAQLSPAKLGRNPHLKDVARRATARDMGRPNSKKTFLAPDKERSLISAGGGLKGNRGRTFRSTSQATFPKTSAAELLQAAAKARPEFIEKTAMTLALLEMSDADAAEDLKGDIHHILNHTVEKTSAANMRDWALAMGGTLASGLAAAAATDIYSAARKGLTSSRNMARILVGNPELKNEDPKKLRAAFNAVHRFSPEFTADPLVGGTLVKQMLLMPDSSPKQVYEALAARKNLHEGTKSIFQPNSSGTAILNKREKDERADLDYKQNLSDGAKGRENADRYVMDQMKEMEKDKGFGRLSPAEVKLVAQHLRERAGAAL